MMRNALLFGLGGFCSRYFDALIDLHRVEVDDLSADLMGELYPELRFSGRRRA